MAEEESKVPYELYGHEFSHAEWMQLMIHFYRGEMNRATVWRQRLDVTTNWAVAATAGTLTFVLGTPSAPQETILLSVVVSLIMLHIEARRYRYYDVWRSRLRIIERGLVSPALWKESGQKALDHEADWRRMLADDLHQARFHMPYWEALGRRLQRNYIWLLLLNYGAWLLKLKLWPQPAGSWQQYLANASVGDIPGLVILSLGTAGLLLFVLLGHLTTRRRHASGDAEPYRAARERDRWDIV